MVMILCFPASTEQIGDLLDEIQNHLEMLPSILPAFRRQLPRPRLLRACFEVAFVPNEHFRQWAKEDEDASAIVPSIRGAWMWLDAIDKLCRVDKQCMRRGCKKRRSGRCSACRTVDYCNVECQRQ